MQESEFITFSERMFPTATDLNTNFEALRDSIASIQCDDLTPVGTIIASMLVPKAMKLVSGNCWRFADGSSCEGTRYANVTNKTHVPDLRGLFLRGINFGRSDEYADPEGERIAGDFELDSFQSHGHSIHGGSGQHPHVAALTKLNHPGAKGDYPPKISGSSEASFHNVGSHNFVDEPRKIGNPGVSLRTGVETKSKNAAIYYYIKVD